MKVGCGEEEFLVFEANMIFEDQIDVYLMDLRKKCSH
jgi:hypothetical protein